MNSAKKGLTMARLKVVVMEMERGGLEIDFGDRAELTDGSGWIGCGKVTQPLVMVMANITFPMQSAKQQAQCFTYIVSWDSCSEVGVTLSIPEVRKLWFRNAK